MSLFIERQYGQVARAQNEAASAQRKADQVGQRLDDLERRTDRLSLACQALWEILREQTNISEDAVFARMEAIDLRDGQADGKIGGKVFECVKCGRTINSRRPVCVYCGTRNRGSTVVE